MYEISEKRKIRIKDNTKILSRRNRLYFCIWRNCKCGIWILASCGGSPMRRNSVLPGLRDLKSYVDAIHEEMLDTYIILQEYRLFSEKASAGNDDLSRVRGGTSFCKNWGKSAKKSNAQSAILCSLVEFSIFFQFLLLFFFTFFSFFKCFLTLKNIFPFFLFFTFNFFQLFLFYFLPFLL